MSDLKELNQTASRFMTQELDRNQCIHGRPQNFFKGEQPYPFQVADDAMQMDVHKTVYSFYLINLCWMDLNSQSFV